MREHHKRSPYLVLLPAGFTMPTLLPAAAVRSYRTFSPFPAKAGSLNFFSTIRNDMFSHTTPGRYPAPFSREVRTFLSCA
tara:strand:+ start:2848 stop:3087 length:240 start_codon:yes stop_codon:yes gene_type:complete